MARLTAISAAKCQFEQLKMLLADSESIDFAIAGNHSLVVVP